MNLIINIVIGIVLALVIVWVGNYVGVPSPISGLVAFVVFLLVAFREKIYTR